MRIHVHNGNFELYYVIRNSNIKMTYFDTGLKEAENFRTKNKIDFFLFFHNIQKRILGAVYVTVDSVKES